MNVMQVDPTFVRGDLGYMKVDLIQSPRLCVTDVEVHGEPSGPRFPGPG